MVTSEQHLNPDMSWMRSEGAQKLEYSGTVPPETRVQGSRRGWREG
jgi:hypothetical protein